MSEAFYDLGLDIDGAVSSDSWAEPLPLQSELPSVAPFREELMPESFRPLVDDISTRMQVPPDYPAVALVLCLAGAVGRRAVIQPKARDSGWTVVPNLWGGIVGPPGFMKSPVIADATRSLNLIQAEWRREYEHSKKEYIFEKEEHELRVSAWKEQFKASTKGNRAAPERPSAEPMSPVMRRLVINDATFEKLHEHMSENPGGVFVIRDELTGWLAQLDKSGREGERAFCLQAWNGDAGFTVDRIGRGTVHVEHCCMGLLGGIQPARLRSYLSDVLGDGPGNDGLIQRFQVLVWPDTTRGFSYVDRQPDQECEATASRTLRKLVELDPTDPVRFRFSTGAQQLFVAWLTDLESKVRGEEMHGALVSHLAKYRKLMPALAILFEMADDAAGATVHTGLVSLEHTRQAASWCDYLESHARRVYSCVINPQLRAARDLADKIRAHKIGTDGILSIRETYLKGWSGLDTPETAKQATEVLEDAGWLRNLPGEPGPIGGRPSVRYAINPKVWL